MKDFILDGGWLFLVALAFVGLLLAVILLDDSGQARWDSFTHHCFEAGGHMYTVDREGWCLTTDGRILEVYP